MATQYSVYYIELKDGAAGSKAATKQSVTKFAWRAPSNTYPDAISKELGVKKATGTETGLIFGMNNPRPVRVRINVSAKQGSSSSKLLFCAPEMLPSVLIKGSLRGKSFGKGTITTVSVPKSSTNPNRKSSSNSTTKTPAKKTPAKKTPAKKTPAKKR